MEHPFVQGIGDGTLPIERLRYWVRQDYLFLVDYCRLFALAAARAPDLQILTSFADLLHATAHTEMDLHRAYAGEFGIPIADLESEEPGYATRAYTDFLLRTATTGDFAETCAALLPCMWAFSDIGQALQTRSLPADPRYVRWIQMYADPEFAKLGDWCRDLVDAQARDAGPATRQRMREAFLTSTRHELAFWDMAWEGTG
jgi:thiaminase/transcriptional activator TenA